jgi:hypothetical protein
MVRSTNAKIKTAKTVLASLVCLGMALGTARAETCWRLSPAVDIIRATQITDEGNSPPGSNFGSTHKLVFGNWVLPPPFTSVYELPFVGAIEFDNTSTPTSQKLRFNVHASNHTTAFGNHTDCTLDALLGAGWTLSCTGNVNTAPFNTRGTPFLLVDCENQPAFGPTEGAKPAGQP